MDEMGSWHLEEPMRLLSLVLAVALGTAGFAAQTNAQVTWNSVTLSWTTPGDDSLTGTAAQFDIRYSTTAITATNFATATRWTAAPTPASSGTRQTTTITGLSPNTQYWFAIKTADEVPNWAGLSNVITRTTAAAPDTVRPEQLAINVVTTTETGATVSFAATGDDSLTGTATSYDVRWSTAPITASNWATATQVTGEPAPAAPGTVQSVNVTGLSRQTTYYFAAKVLDEAGNPSALSNVASVTTRDLTAPAAVRDLAVGFLWLGWHTGGTAVAIPARAPIPAGPARN
jgi:phosphodiesterase/alkaline phosphatase D-like protein